MDTSAEIKRLLQEVIGANPNLPMTATVVSVEGQTCTVKLSGELSISDVRLKATISESQDGLLITPKVNSEVIVMSQTGKLSGLMVIKIDDVDTIQYKVADFEFIIDGTTKKVTIKNGTASVGNLMGTLIDAIVSAQITTPAGPGSIAGATTAQLNQIKLQFQSILTA